jgi:hypothetical protein
MRSSCVTDTRISLVAKPGWPDTYVLSRATCKEQWSGWMISSPFRFFRLRAIMQPLIIVVFLFSYSALQALLNLGKCCVHRHLTLLHPPCWTLLGQPLFTRLSLADCRLHSSAQEESSHYLFIDVQFLTVLFLLLYTPCYWCGKNMLYSSQWQCYRWSVK